MKWAVAQPKSRPIQNTAGTSPLSVAVPSLFSAAALHPIPKKSGATGRCRHAATVGPSSGCGADWCNRVTRARSRRSCRAVLRVFSRPCTHVVAREEEPIVNPLARKKVCKRIVNIDRQGSLHIFLCHIQFCILPFRFRVPSHLVSVIYGRICSFRSLVTEAMVKEVVKSISRRNKGLVLSISSSCSVCGPYI